MNNLQRIPGAGMRGFGGIPNLMFGIVVIILMLVILGLLVYLALQISKMTRGVRNVPAPPAMNSLSVLNERLARGEISEEEYMHKKQMLMQ